MEKRSYLLAYAATLLMLMGCSQDKRISGESSLRLQLPKSFAGAYGKVSAASNESCFAISIRGRGIPETPANQCNPAFGQFLGLASAGATIVVEGIPRDDNHIIDIFYVTNVESCIPRQAADGLGQKPDPLVAVNRRGFGANHVHLIARQPLGVLDDGDNQVTVRVDPPSSANLLSAIAELNIPATCNADPVVITQLQSPVGMVLGSKWLTAHSGKQMHVRLKDQRIEINNNNTTVDGRLAPHRLGDHQ